jgi:hypothetical protein
MLRFTSTPWHLCIISRSGRSQPQITSAEVSYFLQAQSQSATEQLSDEQHPASQEQSGHPEFPQLQPIAKSAANNVKVIVFFIFLFLFNY